MCAGYVVLRRNFESCQDTMQGASLKTDLHQQIEETNRIAATSSGDDLALIWEMFTLTQSTVFRWHLLDGSLEWAANAGDILHFGEHSLPQTVDEWVYLLAEADRSRFDLLRTSLATYARDVEMEYTLYPGGDNVALHVRHSGRVKLGGDGLPETLVSTLSVQRVREATPEEGIASLSAHALAARPHMDHRGYHYPPHFVQHLEQAVGHSIKTNEPGTYMLLAINNLAMIINGYGFETSEHILSEIKRVIGHNLNAHDHVERIHRDQLGIVLADCSRAQAEERALKFKEMIQTLQVASSVGPLHITCSVGSVGFPESARTVAEALDKAYVALNNHNDLMFCAYEDSEYDSEKSREQMKLANYLSDAIVENRLRLAFQPIIASKTGKVAHFESLLRIVDKEGKISSAGPLIPIAERMGLIEVIDRLVLEKVVQELKHHPEVSLAFNISSVTTSNPAWIRYLAQLLEDTDNIAPRMIVEITETAAQRDLRETAYFVAQVQALGCLVSLDDFGSGYTSFRQLKALSVDMLKIDGAFIKDLTNNADNRFFVKTLLDFTSGYGLPAVAEFVENGETAKLLMELGVEYMQGYYFSAPLNYRPWLDEGEYKP